MSLDVMTSATSLPGSEAGRSPCGGPDSKALPGSGQGVVRVSRFRARASARATPTSVTFGPLFTISSPSAALQRCLESRLRARMDVNGSPEFALTWKSWDMPAGEPICALRASGRRINDKGCSGWPTPMAGAKGTADYNEAGNTDSGRRTVELCGWLTCSARDWKDTPGMSARGVNPDGSERKRLDMLPRVALLTSWATPQAHDATGRSRGQKEKHGTKHGCACLVRQSELAGWPTPDCSDSNTRPNGKGGKMMMDIALLAGWATPRAEDAESAGMRHGRGVADTVSAQAGQDATSCSAGTGKRGVLRPGHSRWLMGYPAAWDSCGATAMQSCRKSRRSS